jgi:hypothetical protein
VDYAFAPGVESRLKMLQQLLRDRTDGTAALDTTLIEVAGVTTVAEFIRHVDTTGTLPVSDIVLGSHGNDTGWLEIDIDTVAPRAVNYKVLKEAWDDITRRNRLRIPADMYTTANGQRAPVRVLIKGCRVGQATKFVDGVKMLFGGALPVIAPRHFYAVRPIINTRRTRPRGPITQVIKLGQFEHLVYSNEVTAPTELSRPALLAAYRGRGFQQYDATSSTPNPIPDRWDTWLPSARHLGAKKRPIDYTVSLGRTIETFTTLSGMAEYRHRPFKLPVPITNPTPAAKTKSGFKTALSQRPDYQPGWGPTGFPVHEQLGPANLDGTATTFDQFFSSFTWTPSKDKNADPFVWTGVRHEYNVLLPVVKRPLTGKSTDQLIYNYFPPRGTGGTRFIELLESQAGLFYVSPGAP